PVRDYHLDLAVVVRALPRHHAELQQQLLHLCRQPPAARGVRHLDRVAGKQRGRTTAGELVQMKSGTRLSALRKPAISARTLDRSAARSWMASSCRRLPDAINREDTYRRPPTTLS